MKELKVPFKGKIFIKTAIVIRIDDNDMLQLRGPNTDLSTDSCVMCYSISETTIQ